MGLLATSQFHFRILSVEVNQELFLVSNQMREAVTSVVVGILRYFNEKFAFGICTC
jgi:hypothetical protein